MTLREWPWAPFAAGRIGLAVLQRLRGFVVELHYTDRHRLPRDTELAHGLNCDSTTAEMVPNCEVVTIKRATSPRNGDPVRRYADIHDEARCLYREHSEGKDL